MKLSHKLTAAAAGLCMMSAVSAADSYTLDFEDLALGSADGNPIAAGPAAGFWALDDPFAPTPGREFFTPAVPGSTYHGFTFGVGTSSPDDNPPGPAGSWFYSELLASGYNLARSGTISASTEGICLPAANGNCTTAENILKPSFAITRGTPFRFDGAWFASQSAQTTISYLLYKDGQLVHDQGAAVINPNVNGFSGPTFIGSGYGQLIDEMYVVARQGQFGMDDFMYGLQPIPEPGTYAMFLAGLVGVGAMVRRSSKKAA